MTDFIEIYDNAVSEDYCIKFISFINYLKAAGLCRQEDNLAHNRDHASINFPHALDYDLSNLLFLNLKSNNSLDLYL